MEYAQFLKKDGYATSSTYVNTLISTVNKYGLDKWDLEKVIIKDERPLLKKGSRGAEVESLQIYLNSHGFCCGNTDGIFGEKTKKAVIALQKFYGLTPDGIVGPKTWASLPVVN